MLWYENLFTGKSVEEKVESIKDRMLKKEYVPGIYLVTLASNGVDQLDIIHFGLNNRLMRQYLDLPPILGIAGSKREATDLVAEMLSHVYRETGGCNMRAYFQEKLNEGAFRKKEV